MKYIIDSLKKLRSMPIKTVLFPSIFEDGSIIVDYYIRIMLFFYPMLIFQEKIFGFLIGKTFLYCVLTLLTALLYIILLCRNFTVYRKKLRLMDIVLITAGGLLIVHIIVKMVYGDKLFEEAFFLCCLIGTYFLLRAINAGYEYYLSLPLYSAVFLYIALLKYYLTGSETFLNVGEMVRQPEGTATYLMLTTCISTLQFCRSGKKGWRIYYLIMASMGFFLLSLHGDTVGLCIMGGLLLCVPLVYTSTVPVVKRCLLLCFMFVFSLSNIPFLQASGWFRTTGQYQMQYGIYIDLLLVVAGIYVCYYWERIPKNMDPGIIVMKKIKRYFKYLLAICGMIVAICLLQGKKIAGMPDVCGMSMLKGFSSSLLSSIDNNKSFFGAMLEDYGLFGGGILLVLIIMMMKYLIREWRKSNDIKKILIIIAFLFIIQAFVYKLQPISTPIYVIYVTLALFENNGKITEGVVE